jgi:predicted Zn-dependent protease
MGGSNTKDEKSEDQETDFGIVGDNDNDDDDTILDQINHTGNPLIDEALNDTKTTVHEMEKWIANKTNASEEVIGEIVSAIKDIATTGHFGVNGTNATVPVVQDASVGKQEEEKLEILRNVPEFRYRSEAALGGGISSGTTTTSSATTMLLQNVNAYERKDYFVFGTISMAFCVAFFCAVVLRKHAQKCTAAAASSSSKAKRSGEEEGEKIIADRGDDDDLEKASLMRSIVGKIKYGSVV